MESGFFLDEFPSFSVRYVNSQWCCFARMPDDKNAETRDQVAAVLAWAGSNREKFLRID